MRNALTFARVFLAPVRVGTGGLISRARVTASAAALAASAAALALLLAAGPAHAANGDISTVAGSGAVGNGGDGGPALNASFMAPAGVAFAGTDLLIADFYGHTVRKVNSAGIVTRVAGTGSSGYSGDGGQATSARLDEPADVVVDAAGNVYIADFQNSRVRKVAPNGVISSYAGTGSYGYSGDGGPAMAARLGNPAGLDIDAAGNLYVADFNSTVRKITPSGFITTVAGTGTAGYSGDGGPATSARINQAGDVAVDAAGNVYIGEWAGHRVRKVAPSGTITTVAGTGTAGYTGNGGPATSARLYNPGGLDTDSSGSVFIAEYANHVIRRVTPAGTISRVAGTGGSSGFSGDGGPALSAQLSGPARVALAPSGDFYIGDWNNRRVRRVEALGTPDAPTVSSVSPASPSPSNSVRVIGTAPAGATVRLYTNSSCTSAVAATGSAAQLADPGLAVTVPDDSTTTFWATATDTAGNASGCSATSVTYVEDSTPPAVPTIESGPASPGNDTSPQWSFTGAADAYECRLMRGATVVSDWAPCSGSRSFDLAGQPDGGYTFSVRGRDLAGNTGPVAGAAYELDTAAPAAPSIDAAPATPGNSASPGWSFSAEAGTAVECRLTRGAAVVADWASCSGSKSYDLGAQPDGAYSFAVRARDAAGNTGPASTSDYELDRAAPAAPSIDSAPASPGNDPSPAWAFSGEPGASFECRLARGATVVSDWAPCSGSRSYDLSSEPDGQYTFSVRARDAAGNGGPATTSTYQLDTAATEPPAIDSAPGSPGRDASPEWSFSSGEAGVTFECRLRRGATTVEDWSDCAAPKAYDLSSEPDGTYTFSVRSEDGAGNTGPAASSSYVLDTAAPAAPAIDSAPQSPANGPSPSWSFSAEAGADLECRLERDGSVVSDWSACASPRGYDLSGQADGDYELRVRATDAAGNTGPAVSSGYRLDRVAPAAPSIDSAPASPDRDTTPAWDFSGEPGASFECRLTRGVAVVSDWASCSGSRGYDLSGQPDGTYSFAVRATDAAGNRGPAASSSYQLDGTAPAAPSIDTAPDSPGNDSSPEWGFSGEPGASFECRLARGAGVVAGWEPCSGPRTYDLSSEPDGDYTFSVRARDAVGNTGPAATSDYQLDTAAPAAPTIDAAPASPSGDPTPSWELSGPGDATLECRLQRGGSAVSDWAACSSPRSYDLSSEPDGSYTFLARARDAAGNVSAPAGSGYDLDRSAPAVPSIGAGPGALGNDATPAWSFSGDAGSSFECRLERGATTVSGWAGCTSPRGFDLSGQPDGVYTFAVRARNGAGTVSAPASAVYELDRAAPGAPSIDSSPASPGNARDPRWSFSGESGASFECRLERGGAVVADWAGCSSPRDFDLAGQPDGGYSFMVRARDAAGNTGPAATGGYQLDTTGPGAPTIDLAPTSPGTTRTPEWAFSAEPGATVECRLAAGATVVSDWAACSSPRSFDLSGRPDGTYSFSARARDAAGNAGPAATSDYQLDTTGATVSIESGPGAVGNDRTPEWSFSSEAGAAFECRLRRDATPVSDWGPCSSPRSYDLSGAPDGVYAFSVRARDAQANQGAEAGASYELDTAAPGAPAVTGGPGSPSRDRSPRWSFTGEAGAAFECRLDGADGGVSDWRGCVSPAGFDLAGRDDGRYTLTVRATDAAGNTGAGGGRGYDLDTTAPAAPTFTRSPGESGSDVTPRWSFDGEPGATYECRVSRDGQTLGDWEACESPKELDLASQRDGRYSLAVRATDRAGNVGAPGTSVYELARKAEGDDERDAVQPDRLLPGGAPQPPAAGRPERSAEPPPAGPEPRPEPAGPDAGPDAPAGDDEDDGADAPDALNHQLAPGAGIPEKAGPKVLKALGRAARAVVRHAASSDAAFPGALLALVMCFFAVQNRIDRNDPKLGLAPVFADPDLEFDPPDREP